MFRFLARQINGLFPFLYPLLHVVRRFNFFRGIAAYLKDYRSYTSADREVKSAFPLRVVNLYPIYFDRYEAAGEIPRHYFYQDLWAAKKVYGSGAKLHHDVGSRLDGFIGHCLVFCKVVMLDVRPLKSTIPNLAFMQADGTHMVSVSSNSISSLSALHAVEHFGLGRYSDPIDPLGYQRGINELKRILAPGGNLYFSVPIGVQRVEFNAHRVFSPRYVVELFQGLDLIEFSAIDDNDRFIEHAKIDDFLEARYSCGLFQFRKVA